MSNKELFRDLDLKGKEIKEFRKWARDNYEPHTLINKLWHPVIQIECEKINQEK